MSVLTQFYTTLVPAKEQSENTPHELLSPVFEVARTSASLLARRHEVKIGGRQFELPKFMLLGQRGGGKPIRLALFGGFDAEVLDSTVALARLLLQLELTPALARDYAVFAYPVVNLQGFSSIPAPLSQFEARYASDSADEDVGYFKMELRKWFFDGLVRLHTDHEASGFHAQVRSKILAEEVVAPAIRTLSRTYPLAENPVHLREGDREARLADYTQGRLAPPADIRPYPFEVDLFAPGKAPAEDRVCGLFLGVQEILRNYRRLISHAQNL